VELVVALEHHPKVKVGVLLEHLLDLRSVLSGEVPFGFDKERGVVPSGDHPIRFVPMFDVVVELFWFVLDFKSVLSLDGLAPFVEL
jgi:hypothetical protein